MRECLDADIGEVRRYGGQNIGEAFFGLGSWQETGGGNMPHVFEERG